MAGVATSVALLFGCGARTGLEAGEGGGGRDDGGVIDTRDAGSDAPVDAPPDAASDAPVEAGPLSCDLFQATPTLDGGFDLMWMTTNALSVTLTEGSVVQPVPPSGTKHVHPDHGTAYAIDAVGKGETCEQTLFLCPPGHDPAGGCP